MSELDYTFKEIISRLDNTVTNLSNTVSDLKVLIANEYVKKSEFEPFKASVIGWIIGVYALVVTGIGVFVAIK